MPRQLLQTSARVVALSLLKYNKMCVDFGILNEYALF